MLGLIKVPSRGYDASCASLPCLRFRSASEAPAPACSALIQTRIWLTCVKRSCPPGLRFCVVVKLHARTAQRLRIGLSSGCVAVQNKANMTMAHVTRARLLFSAGCPTAGCAIQGSASDMAGIRQGDELLSIDGVPLASQSPFQAASLLQARHRP